MRVSFPVKDFEGIEIPLLVDVSRIELVMSLLAMNLLAKNNLRCLIAGQTVAPIFFWSTY